VFVAADGMEFTTHDGRKVVDGISSLWCVGAGHNRKPINEAIKKQLDTLDYATAFQASNDKAFKAAEMIAAMAPGDLNKVLFCNSGSEAADTSLKVALAYHRARGEGHRTVFIGREKGYHGVGFGGMSVGGIPANRKMFSTSLLPRVDHMRFIHDPVDNAYINGVEPKTCCSNWKTASCRCTIRPTWRPSSWSRWRGPPAGTCRPRATCSGCARSATSTASC
jgi:beta-alanine--pyruvate transaminase